MSHKKKISSIARYKHLLLDRRYFAYIIIRGGIIVYHLFLSKVSYPFLYKQHHGLFLLNSNISRGALGIFGSFASFDWKDPCTPNLLGTNADSSMLVLLFDVLLQQA